MMITGKMVRGTTGDAQMMKLSDEALDQVQQTGWTREVAFKTTPNVTKLEIKAILESMWVWRARGCGKHVGVESSGCGKHVGEHV